MRTDQHHAHRHNDREVTKEVTADIKRSVNFRLPVLRVQQVVYTAVARFTRLLSIIAVRSGRVRSLREDGIEIGFNNSTLAEVPPNFEAGA
jgi:hypothetical protein